MIYESFKLKFYNELLYFYPDAELQDDIIRILLGRYVLEVSLAEEYAQYKVSNNYSEVFDIFKHNLDECVNQYKFKIDYNKVYPVIRGEQFTKNEKYPFIKETFQADLQVLYIQDCGEMFHYISLDVIKDKQYLKDNAYRNLSRIINPLSKLDSQAEIYTYRFINDLNSSLTLLKNEMERLHDILGNEYLVAIPTTTTVIYAANKPGYYDILNKMIEADPNPNKISDKIYLRHNEILEYANKRSLFTII